MSGKEPKLLYDEARISARVDELAVRISRDHAGRELRVIGVLKGAFIFLADLTRRLTVPHRVDFVSVASYGDRAVSSGDVRLLLDVSTDVRDKHVLLVDDILDSGATLRYLTEMLRARHPASIRTCVMVRKRRDRETGNEVAVDYVGFDIPDVWVVGYGLDYADRFRTLPYIGSIEPGGN